MKTNFRQGLISFQQSGPLPEFLQPSSTPLYVDLSIAPSAFIATIAHGGSDYLLKFDATVPHAWGPLTPGVTNYLYIDVNVISGATTFGTSTIEPITAIPEPSSPVPGQMWFDLTATVMKIRNNDNTKWLDVPRVVVGKVLNGNTNQIVHGLAGTSVGLNVPGSPGFFLLDSQLRPLRTSTGELLTSDSAVRVKTTVGTSGILTNPVNNFVPVRANVPIPAMSLVYLSSTDGVSLASSDPSLLILKTPVGVVESSLAMNEVGVITQSGEITFDQWDWQLADMGKPLYCGWDGEITLTRPMGVQAFRVGYIKSNKTILFYIDSETQPQVYSASGSLISGEPPITVVTTLNLANEVVSTVSISEADPLTDGFMTKEYAASVESFGGRIDTAEDNILTLQTAKSDVGHGHAIADVTGLQTELTDLDTAVGSKAGLVVGAVVGNFASLTALGAFADSGSASSDFAPAAHTHFISGVTGLQTELNGKAPLVHTHAISDVTGLQADLNGKALLVHTHAISDVTGLQADLNSRAFENHTHTIAQVGGLDTALSNKSDTTHTHSYLPLSGGVLTGALSGTTITGTQIGTAGLSVTNSGSIIAAGASEGAAGQMLTSTGAGGAVEWTTPPLLNLSDLEDVNAYTPNDQDVLTWDDSSSTWIAQALPAMVVPVDELVNKIGQVYTVYAGDVSPTGRWQDPVYKPAPMFTYQVNSIGFTVGSAEHHNFHVRSMSATDIVITVEPDSFWSGDQQYWENDFSPNSPMPMPPGGSMLFGKHGGGNVTFVAGVGVTINTPDTYVIDKLHGKATLIKVAPNVWDLEGHLAAA